MKNFILFLIFVTACGTRPPSEKKEETQPSYMNMPEPSITPIPPITSLPPITPVRTRETAITWLNDPNALDGGDTTSPLITTLDTPDVGFVMTPVWMSNWYPSSENGTVPVIEKYDTAFDSTLKKASTWEKDITATLKDVKWSGHCNGLAAASIMVAEPIRDVSYNGVLFTVNDIKALLIEAWQNSYGKAVGKRCDKQNIEYDSNGRMVDDACRDVSPAIFHILLTNFLGRFHKPILIDVDAGYEVWNSPVVTYDVLVKQSLSLQSATQWLTGTAMDFYAYNPQATQWIYFQTQVLFSNDKKKTYEYILERDRDGQIIGGEWFRESKQNHPDFIWRPTKPNPENPYIDLEKIQNIYNKSI